MEPIYYVLNNSLHDIGERLEKAEEALLKGDNGEAFDIIRGVREDVRGESSIDETHIKLSVQNIYDRVCSVYNDMSSISIEWLVEKAGAWSSSLPDDIRGNANKLKNLIEDMEESYGV